MLVSLSYSQNPDSVETRIQKLIEEGKSQLQVHNNTEAFNSFIRARRLSQSLGYNELYFISSIELANFYLMTGESEKSGEIFGNLSPGSSYSPKSNCYFFHRKAFFYNQTSREDSAVYYLKKALLIAEKENFDTDKGIIFNEWGFIYEKDWQLEKAINYYTIAGSHFPDSTKDFANSTYNLGRAYYKRSEFDSAIFHFTSILEKIEHTNWHNIKAPAYYLLAHSYFEEQDSLNAYKSLAANRFSEIEIMKTNFGNEYRNLEIEYRTEQKNLEIQKQRNLLTHEKKQNYNLFIFLILLVALACILLIFYFVIRAKNKKLRKLVRENEFLLGEANHRIKNNLQLIVSLVAREISKNDDHEIDSLRNIASKIESISTLHQHLYLNNDKSKIILKNYMSALCENLKPIYTAKLIDLKCEVQEDIKVKVSQSIYLGLLLNELIINSIKHAFKKDSTDPKIEIDIQSDRKKHLKVNYRDNGKGAGSGQSPKLIDMMCRQLKAEYSIKGHDGFNFEMTLKI